MEINLKNKELGEYAEVIVAAEALRLGLLVSRPYGDSSKYDMLIDNGSKIYKVQVKSSNTRNVHNSVVVVCASGCEGKDMYDVKSVDFIIAVNFVDDYNYIIPIKEVSSVKITMTELSKYHIYKNAWHLLKS